MADIRVERKGGGRTWLWILLAVVVLVVAAFLLYQAGYIELPARIGMDELKGTPVAQLLLRTGGPA